MRPRTEPYLTANDLCCRKRANARISMSPELLEVHGSVAVLIVEREGLDVIAGCKIVGKVTTCTYSSPAGLQRMRSTLSHDQLTIHIKSYKTFN